MRTPVAALGLVIFGATAGVGAAANYPWCALYNSDMLGRECLFSTLQQCQATVSGIGGFCDRNPWYAPAPRSKARSRKKR